MNDRSMDKKLCVLRRTRMLAYYGMELLVHQEAAPQESENSLEEVLKEEI